jgi:hypothetical protein
MGVLLGGGITWFLERERRRAEDRRRLYDQKWETFANFLSTGDLVVSNLRGASKLARPDQFDSEYLDAIRETIPPLHDFMALRDRLDDLYNRLTLVCGERVAGVLWLYLINTEEIYRELAILSGLPAFHRDRSLTGDGPEDWEGDTTELLTEGSDELHPDDRLELLLRHHRQIRRIVRVAARHELSGEPDESLDVQGLMNSALDADPEAKYMWGEKTVE